MHFNCRNLTMRFCPMLQTQSKIYLMGSQTLHLLYFIYFSQMSNKPWLMAFPFCWLHNVSNINSQGIRVVFFPDCSASPASPAYASNRAQDPSSLSGPWAFLQNKKLTNMPSCIKKWDVSAPVKYWHSMSATPIFEAVYKLKTTSGKSSCHFEFHSDSRSNAVEETIKLLIFIYKCR